MAKTVEQMIKELKNSPLYAMSLGSRELYHSNFWAWLMRKNPYMINVFFEGLIKKVEKAENVFNITVNGIGEYQEIDPMDLIQRENANTDIKIQFGNSVFIIENKIKTLPYREQLLKYQYQSKGFKKGCYTGLVNPNFKEELIAFDGKKGLDNKKFRHDDWIFVSYSTISEKITDIMDKREEGRFNCFEKEIIKNYCTDIANINTIIGEKLKNDNKKFEFESDEQLKSISMDDTYKKLKADVVSRDICDKIKENTKNDNADFEFKIENNFSEGNPLISFKYIYKYENRTTNVYSIGIQIQNGNIRRYVETKKGVIKNHDSFFAKFANYIKWFDKDYNKETRRISLIFDDGERKFNTNMSPKEDKKKSKKKDTTYNTFGDFIYQHYTIKDNRNLSNKTDLISNISDNLNYAYNLLSSVKDIFENLGK